MPYVVPPTFVTGNVLTASSLNILSDDIEYINSLSDYVNLPLSAYKYGVSGIETMSNAYWTFVHRHRYLHYYLVVESGTITTDPHQLHLDINFGSGWTTIQTVGAGPIGPSTIAGYVDLNPFSVPDNAKMQVRWDTNIDGQATNYYFLESSFTTL